MRLPANAHPRPIRMMWGSPNFRQQAKPRPNLLSYTLDVICVIIPLLNFLTIPLIGMLPLGEVFALVLVVPCMVWGWKHLWRGYSKTILILLALWLLSQIVTDFYRQSPFQNMAKGEALIAFFGIDLIVLSVLAYKNQRRILLFAIGSVLSSATYYYIFQNNGLWKFGYAAFVIPGVMLGSCYFYHRRNNLATEFCIAGLAGYSLWQNFRSPVLILTIAGIVIFPAFSVEPTQKLSHSDRAIKPKTSFSALNKRTLVLLGVVVLGSVGINKLYSYLASSGSLGDEAQLKYVEQSRGKFGILAGGRPEGFVSVQAVLDSPILGHGSWAEDPKYSEMLTDISQETGYTERDDSGDRLQEGYVIPSHSYLMGAWVFSGLMGAVFWVYIFFLTGIALLKLATSHPPLAPYFALLLVTELWSILFSPFGQGERMNSAFVIVIVCSLLEREWRRDAPRFIQRGKESGLFYNRGRVSPHYSG